MQGFGLGLGLTQRRAGVSWLPLAGPDGMLPVFAADFAANRYYTAPYGLQLGPDGSIPLMDAHYDLEQYYLGGSALPFYSNINDFLVAADGTFSRASDAWGYGSDKALKKFGPNVPRLVYDPVTGAALGYRAEGAVTNPLVNSKFADAVSGSPGVAPTGWGFASTGQGGSMVVSLGEIAGSNKIEFAATDQRQFIRSLVAVSANATYVVSAKAVIATGGNTVESYIAPTALPAGATLEYLVDGVVVASSYAVPVGSHMLAARVIVGATAGNIYANVGVGVVGNVTGSATFERPQFEVGSFRTSDIPTPSSGSATRLADSLSFARAGTPEGTVVIRGRTAAGIGSSNQTLWCWDDGTAANRYRLVRDSSRKLRWIVTVSGVDVVNLDLGTVADNTDFVVAPSFKVGRNAASLNGAASVVDTAYTGPLPAVANKRAGAASDGKEWGGAIASLRTYPKAYDPAQLPGMLS